MLGEPGWDDDVLVLVETVAEELRVRDANKIAAYRERFSRLREAAVFGDEVREVLRRIAAELGSGRPGQSRR